MHFLDTIDVALDKLDAGKDIMTDNTTKNIIHDTMGKNEYSSSTHFKSIKRIFRSDIDTYALWIKGNDDNT